MTKRWKDDGNEAETIAEARRALADPDFPADLRPDLEAAVAAYDRDVAETVAFLRAANAGPGTQAWADYERDFGVRGEQQ